MNDPQLAHRGYFVEQEHPVMGTLKFPGAPFNMEATPWQAGNPAPSAGQHNGEVLAGRLGYTAGQQAWLRSQGVI